MSDMKEIQRAIGELSRDELSEFRAWFMEFDSRAWDREMEEDAAAGRLDRWAAEALEDLRWGRTLPLCDDGAPDSGRGDDVQGCSRDG